MPLPLTLFNRLLRPRLNDNGLQFSVPNGLKVKICSCLACVYRVMDARGKFGEHEKFLKRTKKVNKRPYWLVKNTPHFILWFVREHLIQSTDNCE